MNTRNTVKQEAVTRISKILFGCVLLCAAGGYSVQTYAQQPYDLPPFDQEKAKTLSPEKRAEYDRLLFNEMIYRGGGSRHHSIYTRETEWLAMAADGHELSYLALTTASSGYGTYAPDKALARLDQLADQGNTGAMCLYYWFVKLDDKRYPHAVQLLKRGSDLGQPECQRQYGQLLLPGVPKIRRPGLKTDEKKGFELLIQSAKQGYAAPLNLYLYFKEKGYAKASDLQRAYCWAGAYYDNFDQDTGNGQFRTDAMLLSDIRDYASKHNRQDLILQAAMAGKTQYSLQKCITLGKIDPIITKAYDRWFQYYQGQGRSLYTTYKRSYDKETILERYPDSTRDLPKAKYDRLQAMINYNDFVLNEGRRLINARKAVTSKLRNTPSGTLQKQGQEIQSTEPDK